MKEDVTTVTVRVPTALYLEYKLALLNAQKRGSGRRNTTQDLLAHIRQVVEDEKSFSIKAVD